MGTKNVVVGVIVALIGLLGLAGCAGSVGIAPLVVSTIPARTIVRRQRQRQVRLRVLRQPKLRRQPPTAARGCDCNCNEQ